MATGPSSWCLQAGPYLGEMSALCFVPHSRHPSSPLLLAGTGSQILVYDVHTGLLINSFRVFEGIRVHGIFCCESGLRAPVSPAPPIIMAVYGEKNVKLFSLFIEFPNDKSATGFCVEITLIYSLPNLGHWVMDVRFLNVDENNVENSCSILAVGLSDNSVSLWSISSGNFLGKVKSPERCLLYSMRLWGDDLASFRVASGTIFNEVVIWNLLPCRQSRSPESKMNMDDCAAFDFNNHQYEAFNLAKLKGHEGSILRIAWSADGSKLLSASDDRSARIWIIRTIDETCIGLSMPHSLDVSPGPVLFGHNARVWDCYVSDSVMITASEDCTFCVWDVDGHRLMTLKDHTGRGIWRCLYDPNSSLLLTAGFDSSIRIYPVDDVLFVASSGSANKCKGYKQTFSISTQNLSEQLGQINSKSEYVRCMLFSQEDALYVATNHGYVHFVHLSENGDVKWAQLVRVCKEVPIICMDMLSSSLCKSNSEADDWLVIGDGGGDVTVIKIVRDKFSAEVSMLFSWSAEKERQLLGIFWSKKLGNRYVFTADPSGKIKMWQITEIFQPVGENSGVTARLLAAFSSCFGSRIVCLDASFEAGVLVCGDLRGNVVLFHLLEDLFITNAATPEETSSTLAYFKGAHGISSVASVTVGNSSADQVDICSTGGDGCICFFKFDLELRILNFMGIKRVKELSLIQSVLASPLSLTGSIGDTYAVGFASTDFILWDLINEMKVLVVPCGGWRRPLHYHFGSSPITQNCFAFLKDRTIHVHRQWIPNADGKPLPQVLNMQFHGREIHSICFLSGSEQHRNEDKRYSSLDGQCWVVTGSEDGSIRLTRYIHGMGTWSVSKYIGEHVGGSAVRSIFFTSKVYRAAAGGVDLSCHYQTTKVTTDRNCDNHCLLISVGAKQVITCWLLTSKCSKDKKTDFAEPYKDYEDVSFHWLSTHMPSKLSTRRKTVEHQKENLKSKSKVLVQDVNVNDWRYLAVTGFLVKHNNGRLLVCFTVVACSDTSLMLRAFLLPARLWFDVAILGPKTSPTLALQHVVIPINQPSRGEIFLVISGDTDGSIRLWDLTDAVEDFMEHVSMFEPDKYIDCRTRPRTGRGSQGGRLWKSVPQQKTQNVHGDTVLRADMHKSTGDISSHSNGIALEKQSSKKAIDSGCDLKSKFWEISPLYVMNAVHQSGVNCLSVSRIKHSQHPNWQSIFAVLSGGDDQALNNVLFGVSPQCAGPMNSLSHCADTDEASGISGQSFTCSGQLQVLHHQTVSSAHSSAVKGIWTDGIWVFSTGLDQRVRIWNIGDLGRLTEYAHFIISVPEPETIHAKVCDRTRYQIAVAGRGMQMIEFAALDHEDRKESK